MGLREAKREDIPRIMELLMDDDLGRGREGDLSDLGPYHAAFDTIVTDPNNALYVWDEDGRLAGCLQLTFIPGLSYKGAWLAQVEGVRVDASLRGQHIGEKMMQAVMEISRRRGCRTLQLKTDKRRVDAHRFYKRLGFINSHEAFTMRL
ncbi:MAG: GNAT family N-acetyltransferase [Xanthobacteraceae bacterium]|nr:GNAT family N-acetyltransferase [Xanthobacteraceae bacterium]